MSLFYFFLSIMVSLGVISILRYADRNNRNYEKILKASGKLKEEIDRYHDSKLGQMKTIDIDIEGAVKKAEVVLNQLNHTTQSKGAVSGDLSPLLERVSRLEKDLEESRKIMSDGANPGGISKNIKNMLKESIKEIKTIKTDINKIHSDIEIEKKNISNSIETHNSDLSKRISNYRKELDGFISENWKVFSKQNTDLQNDLKRLEEKMGHLRGDHLEEFQTNLAAIEEKQMKNIIQLKDGYTKLQSDVQKEIEAKIQDYSSYFARLEVRVDDYRKKIEIEIGKASNERMLDISKEYTKKVEELDLYTEKSKTDARNAIVSVSKEHETKLSGIFSSLTKVSNDTNRKITEYEEFLKLSSINIEKIKNDIFSKIDIKQKEIDMHLNNAADMGMKLELKVFDSIKDHLNKFKEKVDVAVEQLNTKISEKVKVNEAKVEKLDSFVNEKSQSIYDIIEKIKTEIINTDKNMIRFSSATNSSIETIENNHDLFSKEMDIKILEIKNTLDENINSIKQDSENSITKINTYFETERVDTFKKIDMMLYNVTTDADNKSKLLSEKFSEKYGMVETQMQNTYSEIVKRSKELELEIEKGETHLLSSFQEKQEQLESRINLEIEKMRDHLEERNNIIYHDVTLFEKKLNLFLIDFENRITDNSSDLSEIEKTYYQKGVEYLKKCEDSINLLTLENIKIQDSLSYIQQNMKTEIVRTADEGKQFIADTLLKGKEEIVTTYKNLEIDTNKKISDYKESLSKIKHNLRLIEDKYETQLEEKIVVMDTKFESKMEIFTEKYRTHINEMTTRSDITENDFIKKIQDIESDYNKKTAQIFIDSKKQLDDLFKSYNQMKDSIKNIESRIDQDIEDRIVKGNNFLDEKVTIFETETIKKINEYKNELLTIRQSIDLLNDKYDAKFEENSDILSQKIKDKYIEVNSKYDQHYNELKIKFNALSEDFNNDFSGAILKNNVKFETFVSKFDDLNEQISDLKNKVTTEINESVDNGIVSIKSSLAEKIEIPKNIFQDNENEFIANIENYKKEFLKIQMNMKQTDQTFTAKFLDHSNILDRRIAQIENEVKKFEKHTQLFDKANSLKDKLAVEVKSILETIDDIKKHKVDIDEMEKKVLKANEIASLTDSKYINILNSSKKIENIEYSVSEIKNFVEDAELRMQKISDARVAIVNVESELDKVNDKYIKLQRMSEDIGAKESIIQTANDSLKRLDSTAKDIESKISTIARKVDDIAFKEETYEKSLKKFEKDASLILQSQDKVMSVIDKFNQMDSLIEDLEVRTGAINKHREWLVKAQTQIENLNSASDKKIKALESLNKSSSEVDTAEHYGEESVKESVIRLKKQGWAIDDIAKTLNRSIGEIELILDLETTHRK